MRRIGILLVVAAAVWAAVYLIPSKEDRKQAETPQGPAWTAPALDAWEAVRVFGPGGEYLMERNAPDGGWTAPAEGGVALRVDMSALGELADFLEDTPSVRRLEMVQPDELAGFGLDKPQAGITLNLAGGDGSDWTLLLGDPIPAGEGVYGAAAAPDAPIETVLVLDKAYATWLDRPAEYYYDKRFTAVDSGAVTRIRLDRPDGTGWEIRRLDAGYEFIWPESEIPEPVAAAEVDLFLHTLTTAEADVLMPGWEVETAPLEARITVWTGGEAPAETVTLRRTLPGTGDEDGGLAGESTWQPAPFALAGGETAKELTPTAFSLRDRRLVELDIAEVEAMEVIRYRDGAPGEVLELRQGEDGWRDGATEYPAMDMQLWKLTGLKYAAEHRPAAPEAAEPVLEWKVLDREGGTLAHLLWSREGDRVWAQSLPEQTAYPVDGTVLQSLQDELTGTP